MTMSVSAYLLQRVRAEPEASRAVALADARWNYCRHRILLQDANVAGDRRAAFQELGFMNSYRHMMHRLKIGDEAYHRMSHAYRAQQRKRATLWDDAA